MSGSEIDHEKALLELAREVVAEWDAEKARRQARGYGHLFPHREVDFARAYIACREPVVAVNSGVGSYPWRCGGCNESLIQSGAFCPACGRPIRWT